MDFLRKMLDGKRTLDDLLAALPSEITAAALFETLAILHRRGVLVEGDVSHVNDHRGVVDDPTTRALSVSESFWERNLAVTRSALTAETMLQRLRTAKVVTLVNGVVGQLTLELLERAGITLDGPLGLGDPSAADAEPPAGSQEGSRTPDTLDELTGTLEDRLPLADLLVVSIRGATRPLTLTINEACLATRTPLIFANEDGEQAEICLVDPYRSACLVCKELRSALVSEFALEDYLFSTVDESHGRWRPAAAPAGELVTTASLVAAHVAGEAVRFVSRGAPVVLVNSVLTIDLTSGSSRHDRILRVPRCPACSTATLSATLGEGR